MKLQVEYRRYRRRFQQPLVTGHGFWSERSGFLLRLTDAEGRCGYGEVAPVPWMGSETEEEAAAFLQGLSAGRTVGDITRLPACRFALDAARDALRPDGPRDVPARRLAVAGLLPAGPRALEVLPKKLREGFATFKWKIGVHPAAEEQVLLRELRALAPVPIQFRLDANASLSERETRDWLQVMDEVEGEFLEQPMPPAAFTEMKKLQRTFATPIALDESVSNARGFEDAHRRGWTGLYVIKPSIFGAMREGEALLPPLRPRIIISSVFETSLGFESVVRWASRWQSETHAAGLNTGEAIVEDGLFRHPRGPWLVRGLVDPAKVWAVASD